MVKNTTTIKVKALRPCKISNNKLQINYVFEAGEVKTVPEQDVNILISTGIIQEVKE